LNNFKDFLEAYSLSKIYKIVLEYTLNCSQLISSSDNKKTLLTTRNVRLDSGHYATKYHLGPLGEVRGPKIFIRCRVYRQKLCDFDVRDFLFEPIDVICMFEEASIEMSCINKEA
jgi:hypothetical protein